MSAMSESAPAYRWEHVKNESLTLLSPSGIVWRFNFSPNIPMPHFHPLQTVDSRCLTWNQPEWHPHHYGLWFSWLLIDGVDYWHFDSKTGRPAGTTQIVKAVVHRYDAKGARISLNLAYHPADETNLIVMEDTVDLWIEVPRDDGSYRIAWDRVSRPRRRVVLDRVPPPGQPNGDPEGGYGGLSFHGQRFLTNVAIVESTGKANLAGHRQHADWAVLTGKVNDLPIGVAMFDHPSNPRYPTPWFLKMLPPDNPSMPGQPFWYMGAALLNDAPLEITPEHPLSLRYLVRVDSDAQPIHVIEDEFRWFSSSQRSSAL
jgi:hypothetical protein